MMGSYNHLFYLQRAEDLLLETDGVHDTERDITLDICIATGEDADHESCCRDYSEILVFLRKLVSNGKVASVEQVLQTLKTFERSCSDQGHARKSRTSSPFPGCGNPAKRRCYRTLSHERVRISAKVGSSFPQTLGPEPRNDRHRRSGFQDFQKTDGSEVVVYAPRDIQDLVNMECGGEQDFRATLLYCAIFTGNEEMVRCLLKWGADASLTLECVGDRLQWCDAWKHSPICVAAVLKHAGIVRCLLAHDASPYQGASREISGRLGDRFEFTRFSTYDGCRDDAATCEALCLNPNYPPPINEVCLAQREGHDESAACMMPYCRWDAGCCNSGMAFLLQQEVPIKFRETILTLACSTDAEKICKKFCCSLIFRTLCSHSKCVHRNSTGEQIAEPTRMIRNLLREGAEPAGLSVSNARELFDAWLGVENAEAKLHARKPVTFDSRSKLCFIAGGCARYRRPDVRFLAPCVKVETQQHVEGMLPPDARHLYSRSAAAYFSYGIPPVVDRLRYVRSAEDPVVQLLVKHGGLPGISTVDEIPFVDGYLHDGPSCQCDVELSAAQRKVSLFDVLTPHPKPKTLAHLCRSAIIEACHGHGVVKAIQSLGLPPVLLNYLLYK